jgi:bifunctional non-homologous end joining protein LigD
MYATLGHALPSGAGLRYEPKYDGVRLLAEASLRLVRRMTRNDEDELAQFQDALDALCFGGIAHDAA